MKVGIVTLTWGQFRRQNPDEWPEERVLREVKEAGFDALSTGPKKDQSPQQLLDYLAGFGLKAAPGYYGGDFWKPELRDEQVERGRRQARTARALGLTELFVAPSGGDYVSRANGKTRGQLSGHVGPGDGLTDDEYNHLADTLNAIGGATLEEGVSICIHNHVGQVIETREEVDRLFSLTDPDAVFSGLDTGHLAWAGGDVVQFARDYGPRIRALHLKDINEEVRNQGQREEWDYGTFSSRGVFTELGQGCIDYPAFFGVLREHGYDGWVLSEIDVTQKPTALQSATECREYLRTLGI